MAFYMAKTLTSTGPQLFQYLTKYVDNNFKLSSIIAKTELNIKDIQNIINIFTKIFQDISADKNEEAIREFSNANVEMNKEGKNFIQKFFHLNLLNNYINDTNKIIEILLREIFKKDLIINEDDVNEVLKMLNFSNLSEAAGLKYIQKEKVETLKDANIKWKNAYDYLKKGYDTLINENNNLKNQVGTIQQQWQNSYNTLKQQYDLQIQFNNNLQQQINQLNNNIVNLQTDLIKWQTSYRGVNSKLESLINDIESSQNKIKKALSQIIDIRTQANKSLKDIIKNAEEDEEENIIIKRNKLTKISKMLTNLKKYIKKIDNSIK